MKKTNRFLQIAGASASVLLIAGCATEKITAEYVMPPAVIKDIKAVDTLEIVPATTLTGNAITGNDTTYANGALVQRIASRLCQEGYYKTTDIVWGNIDGAAQMGNTIAKKKSQHGYARYTTESDFKRAQLAVTLNAKIDSHIVKKNMAYTLTDMPYKEKKVGKVPTGVPDPTRARVQKVTRQVDVFSITGVGNLAVKLTDKNGKVVYEKQFPKLSYHFETSDKDHNSLPAKAAVVAEMIVPAIDEIVADLSPHKEQRDLVVNEDGDEKAVLLLKAQAFSETIKRLDDVLNGEDKNAADYENRGLAYEIIGDYAAAKGDFEEALKLAAGSKIATEGKARIEKIMAGQKALRKMDAKGVAKKSGTQFKSQMKNELNK